MLRQDVIWQLESDYNGEPYHVSGNAILHALAHQDRISYSEQQQIGVSHGVFCPTVYGMFPDWHSKNTGRMSFASTLKPIEKYADLFLFRRPTHPWIHKKKARDAINTPTIRRHRREYGMTPANHVTKKPSRKPYEQQWYIHAYLTAPKGSGILPLSESELDNLQFGGDRNYGFGQVSIKDTQSEGELTDLDSLDYSALRDADGYVLELMTPYVLESEYPHTNDREIPNWWDKSLTYRTRTDLVVEQREMHELRVVDHGQVTKYYGPDPIQTAKNGIERVGTHSKYGYGEIWVRPTNGDENE